MTISASLTSFPVRWTRSFLSRGEWYNAISMMEIVRHFFEGKLVRRTVSQHTDLNLSKMSVDHLTNAKTLLPQVRHLLTNNPFILTDMREMHQLHPQMITMAVLQNVSSRLHGMLITSDEAGIMVVLTHDTCTNIAMNKLFGVGVKDEDIPRYKVVTSENKLQEDIYAFEEQYPYRTHKKKYQFLRWMDPADFLALVVNFHLEQDSPRITLSEETIAGYIRK